MFVGGGTGGHIYPAISMARLLHKKNIGSVFIGSKGGMEEKIVPKFGFKIHLIKVKGLNRVSLLQKLFGFALLPFAILKSFILLLKLKPSYVIGTGAFVSGPVLLAASLMRLNTGIMELNINPGITNKILYHLVKDCWVAFEATKKFFPKCKISSFPVRQEISKINKPQDRTFNNILIFGGSQGSKAINEVVASILKQNLVHDIKVKFQVGQKQFEAFKMLESLGNIEVLKYLDNIEYYYEWADIVVCRAGASTIAELAASKKASVLIPLPTASNNHQMENAKALGDSVIVIPQNTLTPELLSNKLKELVGNKEKIVQLENKISKLYNENLITETVNTIASCNS